MTGMGYDRFDCTLNRRAPHRQWEPGPLDHIFVAMDVRIVTY